MQWVLTYLTGGRGSRLIVNYYGPETATQEMLSRQ
jgi:hypothetical protein